MKQSFFETRQRADELMKEAIAIWKRSDQSEYLEGLEDDPVLSLLMTALAYLSNETDNDIERLKDNVLEDYARMLIPYHLCNAKPACVMVKTSLNEGAEKRELDERTRFALGSTSFQFIPLIKSCVLGGNVESVIRLDGRRWKVSMSFSTQVSDIAYFTFALGTPDFQDLKVTLNGYSLPLIRPWDYAGLSLSNSFDTRAQLYNQQLTYKASDIWLDLFAQQDLRLFSVLPYKNKQLIPVETKRLDFIFEFIGIKEQFVFDRSLLFPDCSILINADFHTVTLSSALPIARVSGSEAGEKAQFLQLLPPSLDQIYGNILVDVRRTTADRFNSGSLVRLINSLLDKLNTDYYAFQDIETLRNGKSIYQLQMIMRQLLHDVDEAKVPVSSGVYLLLKQKNTQIKTGEISLDVTYLTTAGSLVNSSLNEECVFSASNELVSTRAIGSPLLGTDEVQGRDAQDSLARYYMITNDRIVTPADIKALCYNELMTRYNLVPDMIEDIHIGHRREVNRRQAGYEFIIEIVLFDNPFVRRSFEGRIQKIEFVIQKMIEVRSTNIYPMRVNIRIKDSAE
ncbi:MAG: hypothetical protein RR382_01135 [Tannerellaceae bacterium]